MTQWRQPPSSVLNPPQAYLSPWEIQKVLAGSFLPRREIGRVWFPQKFWARFMQDKAISLQIGILLKDATSTIGGYIAILTHQASDHMRRLRPSKDPNVPRAFRSLTKRSSLGAQTLARRCSASQPLALPGLHTVYYPALGMEKDPQLFVSTMVNRHGIDKANLGCAALTFL